MPAVADVIDHELVIQAEVLRHRAESLRTQAERLDEVLATSYRRRAAELELEAWAMELTAGLPDTEVHAPAA